MRVFEGVEALRGAVGESLGAGEWVEVDQQRIDLFAQATDDHQWIHVDPERAAAGPFGATIAHGFLTLSLLSALTHDVVSVQGVRMGVNYGLNRVRFPSPVRVGSRVRAAVTLASVEDVAGGVQVALGVTVEVDGQDKPACVAEWLARYYV